MTAFFTCIKISLDLMLKVPVSSYQMHIQLQTLFNQVGGGGGKLAAPA